MVRVGLPDSVDPKLHSLFPAEAELIPIPDTLDHPLNIDFWIPPLYPKAAKTIYPKLQGMKVVQGLWAGVDWLIPMLPPEVILCDAQGAHNAATAEWVIMAILASLKYLPFYFGVQHSGVWSRRFEASALFSAVHKEPAASYPPALVEDLCGKKVLIMGYGAIGEAIEQRLSPFGVEIVRIARGARPEPVVHAVSELHSLLPDADIVVLIVPLTRETTGMFGPQEFALLKQGALLVNAARGPVVDTNALVETLYAGKIRAALDVTDPEPLPQGHPLWTAPNLLLTPHVAGSTGQFMPRALQIAANQVRRFIAGQPLANVVSNGY
jgi:phosphoglycerate dehydrogenase-like enzyme